jgi:hypothetical protein
MVPGLVEITRANGNEEPPQPVSARNKPISASLPITRCIHPPGTPTAKNATAVGQTGTPQECAK